MEIKSYLYNRLVELLDSTINILNDIKKFMVIDIELSDLVGIVFIIGSIALIIFRIRQRLIERKLILDV